MKEITLLLLIAAIAVTTFAKGFGADGQIGLTHVVSVNVAPNQRLFAAPFAGAYAYYKAGRRFNLGVFADATKLQNKFTGQNMSLMTQAFINITAFMTPELLKCGLVPR